MRRHIIAAALAGVATITTVPVANAAPVVSGPQKVSCNGSWQIATAYYDQNASGLSQKIVMPDCGACNSEGYTWTTGYPWREKLTSIHTPPPAKGCNKLTIYGWRNRDAVWVCNSVCMSNNPVVNLGGSYFNDNVYKVRWSQQT